MAVALSLLENRLYGRIVSGILVLFWICMGVFCHVIYFSAINPAARVFGALFILEGLLFIVAGSMWGKLSFSFDLRPIPIVGAIFILYAMIAYPLLGLAFDHWYQQAPMFGAAPCLTTSFTFGLLL